MLPLYSLENYQVKIQNHLWKEINKNQFLIDWTQLLPLCLSVSRTPLGVKTCYSLKFGTSRIKNAKLSLHCSSSHTAVGSHLVLLEINGGLVKQYKSKIVCEVGL